MTGNFVTPAELDRRLDLYERCGEGSKQAGYVEDRLRKYLRDQLEQNHLSVLKLIEDRAVQIFQKTDLHVRACVDAAQSKILESTSKTIEAFVDKAKRDLFNDINEVIRSKLAEARSSLYASHKSFESAVEKSVWNSLESFQVKLNESITEFESHWLQKSLQMSENSIKSVKEEISHQTKTQVEEHLYKVKKIVQDLRADLTLEMSKKLVDKNAIEQKMRDIEAELNKKAQSVIEFNINQARAQMEHSAKAEVKEGIKNAASQIMTGLSTAR